MKESVSYTYLLNIIIMFIVLTFMVLMGTLSYTKAYRVNSRIIDVIERCEGFNECSKEKISNVITTLGYQQYNIKNCPTKDKKDGTIYQGICVYEINPDGDNKHYSYGVMTFMYMDIPIIGDLLRIPVYSRTDRIYNFDGSTSSGETTPTIPVVPNRS